MTENRAVGAHNRIAYDYLFIALCEMHYGINITKIVRDRSGSGN